ncbi:hypothetical protein RJT34_30293 [Clitoria ternatea]|uniref:Myosin motor domain-containing protein n=1 Tax=Clitoria ternatea TaxID=43366 RepID=A0AAN9EST8_CLITE
MVLSASPCSLARSSLEEMLESLRRKDEEEEKKAKDSPPALPARPASRARLPPARRSLPNDFKVGGGGDHVAVPVENRVVSNEKSEVKELDLGHKRRRSDFGSMRVKEVESPYLALSCADSSRLVWELEGDAVDNISYFIKKVMKVARSEIVPANPDILEGVDDLIKLGFLNEPSSKAGPILIALNPFKDLQIYGHDYVSAYRQRSIDSSHVYSLADAAYNKMIRDEVNQSIIISGESGSGKTETAKIAMQYLAALGGSSCEIEKVLQMNAILEAFGNAKTSTNDNSSRFSRVVQLASGERSYHVFYQLCAGSSPSLKERLNLRAASEYKYLNQSDCITIDGVDDAKNFHQLMKALNTVQISKEDQEELIFRILAAILWLGNISFEVTDSENHIEVVDSEAVTSAAQLMGCSSQELIAALSTHKVQSDNDTNAKSLTLWRAIERRDAIAKFIYASLFDWILEQLNKSLEVGKKRAGKSISILDIFGFQRLQRNCFEHFCVNYANERLQQHFYRHLFKLEQEDYELDGINWTKVDFFDNQECLDLFEKKNLGILSLLDEESNLPKASDLTFANKLKHHLGSNPCFKGERGRAFSVRHFAGEVMYDTNGFLEKNRDTLSSDSIQFLSSCNCKLLQLFSKMFDQSRKQSVGTMFKGQLFKLMHQLESSTPHFIHCIKPTTKQLPGIYDDDHVLQQLRCCGVLEIVRLSKAGYPTRMTHQEFSKRYGFLLSEANVSKDMLSISVAVLQNFNIPSEMYQVGYTKLYLRAGQISALEDKRKQALQGIIRIQKCFRGHQARSDFCDLKNAVATLQSFIRGEITRRKHGVLVTSSITIYSRKLEEIHAIILLQSAIRGWLVRKNASHMNKYPENAKLRWKSRMKIPDLKDLAKEPVQNLLSALVELQRHVNKADAMVEQKEEENTELREQLKQSERKRIEHETRMKAMEEAWQKQMASFQMSLVAARKSLAPESAAVPPRRDLFSPCFYESEDAASLGSRTPGGSTPKFSSSLSVSDAGRQVNGTLTTVSNLMREFEQRTYNFDDEVRALNGIKMGQSANVNSAEELRKLKQRFEGWKKQYKVRLRETKARIHKLGNSETEKSRRTWWGKLSSRA